MTPTNFQGPGYIRCPITTTTTNTTPNTNVIVLVPNGMDDSNNNDSSDTTSMIIDMNVCDSIHIDPFCSTLSSCDWDSDVTPFVHQYPPNDDYDNDDDEEHSSGKIMRILIIPLICDCMKVYGCPPSCTWSPFME